MIIGYIPGTFDLSHIGHLNILRKARSMCDKRMVGVSTDALVLACKHKSPVIPPMVVIVLTVSSHLTYRACAVAALYGLLSSLVLSVYSFVVGFVKARRLAGETSGLPALHVGAVVS